MVAVTGTFLGLFATGFLLYCLGYERRYIYADPKAFGSYGLIGVVLLAVMWRMEMDQLEDARFHDTVRECERAVSVLDTYPGLPAASHFASLTYLEVDTIDHPSFHELRTRVLKIAESWDRSKSI